MDITVRMIHKNTGLDQFSNFMSIGLAKSVLGPVVMNDNETCPATGGDWQNVDVQTING